MGMQLDLRKHWKHESGWGETPFSVHSAPLCVSSLFLSFLLQNHMAGNTMKPPGASATRQIPRWLSLLQSKYAKEEMHQPGLGRSPSSHKSGCESESCYLKRWMDNRGERACVVCKLLFKELLLLPVSVFFFFFFFNKSRSHNVVNGFFYLPGRWGIK